VKIPKGIKSGQKIRLAGQGAPGLGEGDKGDMYIKVDFEKHPYLKADGADVYLDLPVAPWEAALGNSINIPAPGGNIKMKIPAGSQQGKKLRLKGKGIPSKTPGDLYVVKDLDFNPRANFGG
jgi:curved DNA-binding protein